MSVLWFERSMDEVPSHDGWLSPREREHQDRLRFPRRRADWRLGRWTAKCAVAAFPTASVRFAEIEIRAAPSGVPGVWIHDRPAEWRISLSHRAGIAVCAISSDPIALGCDLEVVEPRSPAFVSDYFNPLERTLITRCGSAEATRLIALIWSAKESALKALGVGLRADTRSVSVTILHDPELCSPCSSAWRPVLIHSAEGRLYGWCDVSGLWVRTVVIGSATCGDQEILKQRILRGSVS